MNLSLSMKRVQHNFIWQSASKKVIKFLDIEVNEPRYLVLKKHCILRLTANIDTLCQGNVCFLADLAETTDFSIAVNVAPHVDAVADTNLFIKKIF